MLPLTPEPAATDVLDGTVADLKVMVLPSTLSVEPSAIRFAVVSALVALFTVTVPTVEPVALVRPKNFRMSLAPEMLVVPPAGEAMVSSPAALMLLAVLAAGVVRVAAPAATAAVWTPLARSIAFKTSPTVAVVVVPAPRKMVELPAPSVTRAVAPTWPDPAATETAAAEKLMVWPLTVIDLPARPVAETVAARASEAAAGVFASTVAAVIAAGAVSLFDSALNAVVPLIPPTSAPEPTGVVPPAAAVVQHVAVGDRVCCRSWCPADRWGSRRGSSAETFDLVE